MHVVHFSALQSVKLHCKGYLLLHPLQTQLCKKKHCKKWKWCPDITDNNSSRDQCACHWLKVTSNASLNHIYRRGLCVKLIENLLSNSNLCFICNPSFCGNAQRFVEFTKLERRSNSADLVQSYSYYISHKGRSQLCTQKLKQFVRNPINPPSLHWNSHYQPPKQGQFELTPFVWMLKHFCDPTIYFLCEKLL